MANVSDQAVFRANLARIRGQRGLTQEDLARLGRLIGLRWLPVTVRAIESGRRKLSLGEAVLLQALLNVPLSELAETKEATIEVEGVPVSTEVWRQLVLGRPAPALKIGLDARDRAAEAEAQNEAESKAARRLGKPAVEVVEKAHEIWGHGLTEERDRRLQAQLGSAEVGKPGRQALRGHITRELLERLREAFQHDEQKRREAVHVVMDIMKLGTDPKKRKGGKP